MFFLVVFCQKFLFQERKTTLNKLKLWVCTGEALNVNLARAFFKNFPNNTAVLCNFYGCTETMADVAYHVMYGPEEIEGVSSVPIGE